MRAVNLPEGAFEAWRRLSGEQRRVLRLRCAGLTFADVGRRVGVSRQRIQQQERKALAELGRSAGRPVKVSVTDVLRDGRDDCGYRPGESLPISGGAMRIRAEAEWDRLVDSFIASGGADRERVEQRARELAEALA